MRKALVIGLGALAAATAAGVALVPSLRACRLDPPVPQPRASAPGAGARPSARVSIPLDLPVRAIVDLATAKGPASLSGTGALPALKQAAETSITWTLSRSALAGAGEDGRLVLKAALTGGASLRGRTRPGQSARGGPGRTLPRAFTESVDVAADIRVVAEPRLNPGWRIEPNFQPSLSLRRNEARVGDLFTLDLRGTLLPGIEASLKQELDAAGARVASHPFLEKAARATWDRLCTSLEVGTGERRADAATSSLWLDIEPKGWSAGRPVVTAEAITIPLSARAGLTLSEARRGQAECEPFPDRLDPSDAAGPDGRIALESGLDLAALSAAAAAQLAAQGRAFSVEGASAELDTLGLSASGDAILIAVDGRFRQPGPLGASAAGRLYVLARPALDPGTAALSLAEPAIDPASAEALAGPAGGAFSALAPEIARRLGALRFDLAPQRERLAGAAAAASDGLARSGGPLGIAALALGEVRLVGLRPSAEGLRLRAEAEGSMTLRPVALSP